MRARIVFSALILATAANCWLKVEAALDSDFHFITSKVELVRDELERVAKSGHSGAQLTVEQLNEAYEQTQKWGYQVGGQIKESDQKIKVVAHLLVAMHDYFGAANCVERLVAYYSLLGQEFDEFNVEIGPITIKLVESLLDLSYQQVSKELLDEAKSELDKSLERFNSIPMSELAQTTKELEDILTFVNYDYTRVLAKRIYPKLEKANSQEGLESLKLDFYFEMRNMGYVVDSGMLVKLPMPTLD